MTEHRECGTCRIVKRLEEFEKNKHASRGYRHTCKECRNSAKRNHYQKINIKFGKYRQSAKVRSLSFDLSLEEFASFWQKPCTYCGDSIQTIGIDRLDSSIGYNIHNCTSCCAVCNRMKLDHTFGFWINHMKKVINKMENK